MGQTSTVRTLVVTQPGDGHLNPLIPVAEVLRCSGHELLFATSPSFIADVERVGHRAVGVGPPFRWDSALEIWPDGVDHMGEESLAFWARRVNRDITVPLVQELRPVVETFCPDVVVAEYAAGAWAQAIADSTGVPFVVTGWAEEPGHETLTLDEIGGNDARRELGLSPITKLDPAMWVVFTPFDWGALAGPPEAATRRYRLPLKSSGAHFDLPADPPVVYATLGTVFNTNRRLLKTFIAAIEEGGWTGLVTVGRNNDPERFQHSDRVIVERYVPQADILAHTDVMVCHGGLGAMLGAMESGCPMVVVPLGGDQLGNADMAARLGIATVIQPAPASPSVVADAIASVLTSTTHRDAADHIQREVAAMTPLDALAQDLASLTGS